MKLFAELEPRIFSFGVTIRKTPLTRNYKYEFNVHVAWLKLGIRFTRRKFNGPWI